MGSGSCSSCRRDKYEKNLLWYWVDTKYKGLRTEEDKETLRRRTDLGGGSTTKVPLGLARPSTKTGGAAPPSDSDNDEGGDASEDDDGESESKDENGDSNSDDVDDSPKSKKTKPRPKPSKSRKAKRKRDDLDEELPDEAPALLHACEALIGLANDSASIINPFPRESKNP